MPFPIEHVKVSAKSDGGDATLVLPSDWNATHTGIEILRVTADRTNATTNYANITDLTWSIAANEVCAFHFDLLVSSSATTVGVFVSLNGPTIGTGVMNYMYTTYTTATAVVHVPQTGYDATTGQPTAALTTRLPGVIYGTIENGTTAGTMAIRFRAEAAGTVTVARGSWGIVAHL